jgi:hypothetical protein
MTLPPSGSKYFSASREASSAPSIDVELPVELALRRSPLEHPHAPRLGESARNAGKVALGQGRGALPNHVCGNRNIALNQFGANRGAPAELCATCRITRKVPQIVG